MDIFNEIDGIITQLEGLTAVKPAPSPQDLTTVLRDNKERYTEEQAELAMSHILPKHIMRFLVEHHLGYIHRLGKQGLAEGDE